MTQCESRVAQLSWRLLSENYSRVIQFIIEYNTSFNPDVWHVAKTQLARTRFFQRITLSPYANYSFRVLAENKIGVSKPSVPTQDICNMPPDVPHHNPKGVCTLNTRPKTLIIKWQVRILMTSFVYQHLSLLHIVSTNRQMSEDQLLCRVPE